MKTFLAFFLVNVILLLTLLLMFYFFAAKNTFVIEKAEASGTILYNQIITAYSALDSCHYEGCVMESSAEYAVIIWL